LPTAQLLASAAEILDLGDIGAVREDLDLPRTGPYASALSWESSHPNVVSESGRVSRPGPGAPDAEVTLTATVMLSGAQTTKSFLVTVKSLEETP
jgi:arabinan endo-1,5-alpha-L-arabinosidase